MRCDGERIVESARTWLGTRRQNQGSLKGLGADCLGFVVEAAREAGAIGEGEGVRDLIRRVSYVPSLDDAAPGDVIVFGDPMGAGRGKPRHLAYFTHWKREGIPYAIHMDRERVVEHRLDFPLQRRVVSLWRFNGGEFRPRELAEAKRAELLEAAESGALADPFTATIFGSALLAKVVGGIGLAAVTYGTSPLTRALAPGKGDADAGRG